MASVELWSSQQKRRIEQLPWRHRYLQSGFVVGDDGDRLREVDVFCLLAQRCGLAVAGRVPPDAAN